MHAAGQRVPRSVLVLLRLCQQARASPPWGAQLALAHIPSTPLKFPSDPDLTTLALGTDLTTLGLNLNSPEALWKTFASPWADGPGKPEPDFKVRHSFETRSQIARHHRRGHPWARGAACCFCYADCAVCLPAPAGLRMPCAAARVWLAVSSQAHGRFQQSTCRLLTCPRPPPALPLGRSPPATCTRRRGCSRATFQSSRCG